MDNTIKKFIWRFTSSHIIAYFIAGIFAILVMDYKQHYSSSSLSLLMKPVNSPIVALGPALQLIRGLLISVILLPVFLKYKLGNKDILKLAWLYFGLSFLSTFGPAPGSFEGYIYTTIPFRYQMLGVPEALIYLCLFMFFIWIWYHKELKIFRIISVIMVILICFFSAMGYLSATGNLHQ